MSRDRVVVLDDDVARVVRFMEREVPADRLEDVAARLPAIARLLWSEDKCAFLDRDPIRAQQPNATEYVPVVTTEKRAVAKAYIDAQLNVIRKHGREVKLSDGKYKSILRKVERAMD